MDPKMINERQSDGGEVCRGLLQKMIEMWPRTPVASANEVSSTLRRLLGRDFDPIDFLNAVSGVVSPRTVAHSDEEVVIV